MQIFGGGGLNNLCRSEAPALYWWLVTNIILFYIIVAFGLATWGSYLCKVAKAQEDITNDAVQAYVQTMDREHEKHVMIAAGPSSVPMLV